MTPHAITTADAWARYLLSNWLLEATLLLLAATVLAAIPRLRPGTRHNALLATLVLAAAVAGLRLVPLPQVARLPELPALATAHSLPAAYPSYRSNTSYKPAVPQPAPIREHPPWGLALASLWAAGALLRLVYVAGGSWTVARWRRRSVPVDPALIEAASPYAALGLQVLESSAIRVPSVTGVLRPCILLPRGFAQSADPETLRHVLLHEAAHAHRGDPLRLLVAEIAGALLFWHPLAYVVRRALDRTAEDACDAQVLESGIEPGRYAATLLTTLTGASRRALPSTCPLGAPGRELRRRLEGLLRGRQRTSRVATAAGALVIAAAAVGAAGLEVGLRPQPALASKPSAPQAVRIARRLGVSTPAASRPVQARQRTAARRTPGQMITLRRPVRTLTYATLALPDEALVESELAASRSSEPPAGRTVVYLLDVSGSMRPHQAQAREELLTRIRSLGLADRFNVLAFAGEVRRFSGSPVARDEGSPADVQSWLAALPDLTGTAPEPALSEALTMPAVTSVVLVTDHETTTGEHWTRLGEIHRTQNRSAAALLTLTFGASAAEVAGQERNVPAPGIISMLVTGETVGDDPQ